MNSVFMYGTLKQGEIAFSQIKNMVETITAAELIDYEIGIEDNLPKIFEQKNCIVKGDLIKPKKHLLKKFFETINDYEGGGLYKKISTQVNLAGEISNCYTYIATGVPGRSFIRLEESAWYSRKYPNFSKLFPTLFGEIKLLGNESHQNSMQENYWNYMIKLQGYYLNLFAILENYCLLVIGPSESVNPNRRINMVGFTKEWIMAYHQIKSEYGIIEQTVRDARPPFKEKDNATPETAIRFYYQIKNNITHQGKSSPADQDLIYKSLKDLSLILRKLLIIKIDKIEDEWILNSINFQDDAQ